MVVTALLFTVNYSFAWMGAFDGRRPYKDAWGNSYKYYQNLWKDTDRDGVINYYDYNDRNPYIQNPYQKNYYNRNFGFPRLR